MVKWLLLKIPRPFSAARTVSSTNRHWENKISTCKRTRVDMYLTPYIKINSKWIKHLKVRLKTIKLLAKNIGGKLHDIGFDHFLTVTPKAQTAKAKPDKQDNIKLEKLTHAQLQRWAPESKVPNSPSCLWFSFPVSSQWLGCNRSRLADLLALGKFWITLKLSEFFEDYDLPYFRSPIQSCKEDPSVPRVILPQGAPF